ncbi:MAG: ABC transporter permease, partial [Bacteroidota bacterium]
MTPHPPRWAERFLEWFCREDLHDAIRGDLEELYTRNHHNHGPRKAAWLFIWHVILFFQPFTFKKKSPSQPLNPITMFTYYFKISWRNFGRNRAFSLISLLGLTIGMIALLFIGEYVRFEKSYDLFHEKADRLYRLRAEGWHNDGREWFQSTANFPVAGPQVHEKVPEVEAFVRLHATEAIMSPRGEEEEKSYKESDMYYADSSFLTLFSFPLLYGDKSTALREPNSIVITESAARKYFGETNAIGKQLQKDSEELLTITGILKDIPENSHLDFDFILSYYTLDDSRYYDNWGWTDFYTYVQVTPGAEVEHLHDQFDAILHGIKGEYYENVQAKEYWRLQPLAQIHLHSGFNSEAGLDAQADIIHLLLAIGLFVMVLAWINFINMSTARAIERGKEVGIQKTIGATRKQVIAQFLLEAFLINGLAMMCAILMVKVLAPSFTTVSGQATAVNILDQALFWKMVLGIWVVGSLGSGFYPAFVMSSFQPMSVLKGKGTQKGAFSFVRKGLVVFQFAIAIAIIIGTVAIYLQIRYMRSQNLGFQMEQMYVIQGPKAFPVDSTFERHLTTFKVELLKNPQISKFTASQSIPSFSVSSWGGYIRRGDQDASHAKTYGIMSMDDHFLPTYELDLVAGRNFSKAMSTDSEAVIINETALKQLEFDSPEAAVGKMIYCPLTGEYDGTQAQVIGVVRDHHHHSLRNGYSPIIYTYSPASPRFFSLLLDSRELSASMAFIQEVWRQHFGAEPMEGFFLDDRFNEAYEADLRLGKICAIFSGLAIIIALMGLFGLSIYMTAQRTKEISIRKILGATVSNIVGILVQQYLILVLLSGIFAIPFTYWLVHWWLDGFAFS